MAKETNMSFGMTMAESYDRLFAPLMFEPCAEYISEEVKAMNPTSVLETAAGTGVLTQALTRKLSANAEITATDLSEAMLNVAKSKSYGDHKVAWQPADATQLPFADASFDVAVCQFGIMFFPDKQAGFREAERVLKPGGRCIFVVWTDWMKMEDAPLRVAAVTIAKMLGCDPTALVNPPYFDESTILQDIGVTHFENVQIKRVDFPSTASSAKQGAEAIIYGSLFRNAIEKQGVISLEEAARAAEEALQAKFGNGRIEGRVSALVISAQKAQ